MRLLEGVVLNKAFLFAVLLLGGLRPPDPTGAVKCYTCQYDSYNENNKDKNCFEGGVPMRVDPNNKNEEDCVSPNHDDMRCLLLLVFGFSPNIEDYELTKGCLKKRDIDCFEKLGLPKNQDDCYTMTTREYKDYIDNQCTPGSGRKRRSLGYDGTGNPPPGMRQTSPVTEDTLAYCICTGDHCGKYAPESMYQAAGLTKPGGDGGGGGGGDGSGTSSTQGAKWITLVGWTVVTLAFAVIGIYD